MMSHRHEEGREDQNTDMPHKHLWTRKNSVSHIGKDCDLGIVVWWSDGVAAFAVFLAFLLSKYSNISLLLHSNQAIHSTRLDRGRERGDMFNL